MTSAHTFSNDQPQAQEFARALRRAMAHRGVNQKMLAAAMGANIGSVGHWYRGNRLITPQNADRVAEALDWPAGRALLLRLRTKSCQMCGADFVDTWRMGKALYCSRRCMNRAGNLRQRNARANDSLARLHREATFSETLDAWCRSCEPDGICKTPECMWQTSELSRWPLSRMTAPVLPVFVKVRVVA